MEGVHAGQELIDHAKDSPDGKHPHGNAQHRQASEPFVMPQIKPDFVPDNAHHAHPCSQSN